MVHYLKYVPLDPCSYPCWTSTFFELSLCSVQAWIPAHNVSTDRAYFVHIKHTVAMKEEGKCSEWLKLKNYNAHKRISNAVLVIIGEWPAPGTDPLWKWMALWRKVKLISYTVCFEVPCCRWREHKSALSHLLSTVDSRWLICTKHRGERFGIRYVASCFFQFSFNWPANSRFEACLEADSQRFHHWPDHLEWYVLYCATG